MASCQEAQNALRSALLFVAVPDGAGREIRSEGDRPLRLPPEPPIELEEQPGGAPVAQVRHRVVLGFRQGRLEQDFARSRRRHRTDEELRRQFAAASARLVNGDGHAVRLLRHATDDGVEKDAAAEPFHHTCREAVVALRDAEDVALPGRS
jgi:hypothetical protein